MTTRRAVQVTYYGTRLAAEEEKAVYGNRENRRADYK